MAIGYYPGCSLKQSSRIYDEQTKAVFKALGQELAEIRDWNCCGATSAGKLDDFLAVALSARNIGLAEAQGLSSVMIPCTGCYSGMLSASHSLMSDPGLMERVNRKLAQKVHNSLPIHTILEALWPFVENGTLANKAARKLKGLDAVCYYGCITRFATDIPHSMDRENPMEMENLLEVLGVHALDWDHKTFCCGAAAAVNDPPTAYGLMGRIMNAAISKGASMIVVTCPMCQLNLDVYQEDFCRACRIKGRLPILFITELIGLAMGIAPEVLGLNRHMVDAVTLFQERNIL